MADAMDLALLHDVIVKDIKAQFPDLKTVQFYQEAAQERESLPLPACLLTMTSIEVDPEDDPGTEQLPVNLQFEASFIVNAIRTERSQLSVRVLAAAFMTWLKFRRWNPKQEGKRLITGPAYVVSANPDNFQPAMDKYDIWTVEWYQPVNLGKSIWADDNAGETPQEPVFNFSPEIGSGHENQYQKAVK